MIEEIGGAQFWVALLQIIGIDLILSGDNAVVIALACRSLPPRQRKLGIMLGAGAAIALRIIFATIIVYLLAIPYLRLIGGLLLLWIAVKLLLPQPEDGDNIDAKDRLWDAVKTIAVADAVMSLDNVVGIGAAAKGNVTLIVLGLLISIPLIIWGSTLILRMLDRYPLIVVFGGALLGYVAGDLIATDPLVQGWLVGAPSWLHWTFPIVGAIGVVIVGRYLNRRHVNAVPT